MYATVIYEYDGRSGIPALPATGDRALQSFGLTVRAVSLGKSHDGLQPLPLGSRLPTHHLLCGGLRALD